MAKKIVLTDGELAFFKRIAIAELKGNYLETIPVSQAKNYHSLVEKELVYKSSCGGNLSITKEGEVFLATLIK